MITTIQNQYKMSHQFYIKYIKYSKVLRPDTIFGHHHGDMISQNLLKTFPPAKKISNNAYWPSNYDALCDMQFSLLPNTG